MAEETTIKVTCGNLVISLDDLGQWYIEGLIESIVSIKKIPFFSKQFLSGVITDQELLENVENIIENLVINKEMDKRDYIVCNFINEYYKLYRRFNIDKFSWKYLQAYSQFLLAIQEETKV